MCQWDYTGKEYQIGEIDGIGFKVKRKCNGNQYWFNVHDGRKESGVKRGGGEGEERCIVLLVFLCKGGCFNICYM